MQNPPDYNINNKIAINANNHEISILVVDDEPGICDLLKKALGRKYKHIDSADNISKAEELRQKNRYDIVLLDINLPDRSGVEWHELFRNNDNRSDVIFITGYANLRTTIQALRLGAVDFILKPFSLEQINKAVEKCVHRRLEQKITQI